MRHLGWLTLLAFSLASVSCGGTEHESDGARAPIASAESVAFTYDSLALAENQEIFIGSPFSLIVVPDLDDDGALKEIWVSDFYSNTLLQFDGTGRFVRRLGGAGLGPQEFSTVGQMFLSADEVGAVEMRRREVKWFSRDDGSLRRVTQFRTGSIGISPPVSLGDLLVFPLLDPVKRTSIGLYQASADQWTRTGPLPEPYRRSYDSGRGAFASFFRYLYLDQFDQSSVLLAFSGVDSVYRFDPRANEFSVLGAVPSRIRRGLEGECRFAGDAPDPARAMRECGSPRELFSTVSGAWRLDDGRIAVIHTDQQTEGEPPRVVVTGTSYLTLLSLDSGNACVDLRIPGGQDSRAVYDLKTDALFILDRRLSGTSSTLWLLRVPIPPESACPGKMQASGWRYLTGPTPPA